MSVSKNPVQVAPPDRSLQDISPAKIESNTEQPEVAGPPRSDESVQERINRLTLEKKFAVQSAAELTTEVAEYGRLVARLESELVEEARQLQALKEQLAAVLSSTAWKSTAMIRRLGEHLPSGLRSVVRKSITASWPSKRRSSEISSLREKAAPQKSLLLQSVAADVVLPEQEDVRKSHLFDADYYLEMNPDVVASGASAIEHYLKFGGHEGRDPSEAFSSSGYLERYPDVAAAGFNPLLHYLRHGKAEGRTVVAGQPRVPAIGDLYEERWPAITPIPIFGTGDKGHRLTVVTDSVGTSSLFGGVGTALILGAQYCNATGATLRVATRRDSAPDAGAIGAVLKANGVDLRSPVQMTYIPEAKKTGLPFTQSDIFLTTSWWTTKAVLGSVEPERVAYLLQEDERMFYSHGDERLLCSELLNDPRVFVAVNTRLLFNHFSSGPGALQDFARRSIAFEPAFRSGESESRTQDVGVRKFFFYSRPNHSRNLFWRGAMALGEAIEKGVFARAEWDFYFVGAGTPPLKLPHGVIPKRVEGLSWMAYQKFVAEMDAALVLMDTPHPSYPPLDLASAGVAVLTNSHQGKVSLTQYSNNIILCPPQQRDLVDGLVKTVALAENDALRKLNRSLDGISRDWNTSLADTVTALKSRFAKYGG